MYTMSVYYTQMFLCGRNTLWITQSNKMSLRDNLFQPGKLRGRPRKLFPCDTVQSLSLIFIGRCTRRVLHGSTVIRYKPGGVWLHFNPAVDSALRVRLVQYGSKRTARLCDAVTGKRCRSFHQKLPSGINRSAL